MAVMLANFVPCTPKEAGCIIELGTGCLLAWTDDSSLEEEGEQMQEEDGELEVDEPEEDEHEEIEEWGNQTPKCHPVMRCVGRVKLNWRSNHDDDRGSGHP